jgi:succinoglycan biosynthesis protein ExoM
MRQPARSASVSAPSESDCVSVCVCTFQRPALLAKLLDALAEQSPSDAFTFEVVVVENDERRPSEPVVNEHAARSPVPIRYDCEPERNISLARNRAIRNAGGNLIAFIDDDESPGPDWLFRLHCTLRSTGADGVLGPVVPDLPPAAPRWLRDGRVFDRPRHSSGTAIGPRDARTGNVLLRRSLFLEGDPWFDPGFGRTGGEDTDFFMRQRAKGRVFVWCDEAAVYEVIPPERWGPSFHLRRMWRSGTISGERVRDRRLPRSFLLRNAFVLGGCLLAAPASLLLAKHRRMKVALKAAYCSGVVTAALGWSALRDRE